MGTPKILVVDDEPIVTTSCQRILAEEGYDVDIVQSGWEGLNRALRDEFDLVMTDLRMPDLDGMEIVRSLARERPDMAVVVITGYGTIPSAVEAAKLGVRDYIEKPFTPEQIADAVNEALATASARPKPDTEIEQIKQALRKAAADNGFGERLLVEGSRVLSGFALASEAKAAIASGDVAWIEKRCGALSEEERAWLEQRLEAEIW